MNPLGWFSPKRRDAPSPERAESSGPTSDAARDLRTVRAYHAATGHDYHAYARGPHELDWDTQPDPFRRYAGAELLALDHVPHERSARYADVFGTGRVAPAAVDRASVSQLFEDSLAISAWKEHGGARWALRVNPSSGNLHPTEGYLLSGPIAGLAPHALLAHYAPREHALELRARVPDELWRALCAEVPPDTFFVGLTSIHWREAWKYGERAWRYCQHDAGHAIGCFAIAAAGLGWRIELVDDLAHEELGALLGVGNAHGAEPEVPDCLLAVIPSTASASQAQTRTSVRVPEGIADRMHALELAGRPNELSSDHVEWSAIDAVAQATRKPRTRAVYADEARVSAVDPIELLPSDELALRKIVHRRRSAQAFDGATSMDRASFYRMLAQTVRRTALVLPWAPRVHFALFVERVRELEAGLYCLARDPAQLASLRTAFQPTFVWHKPPECPHGLGLYLLLAGDKRSLAQQLSCTQAIAADGCFSLGMVAQFEPALAQYGAWFYARLFWETGLVGQVLYDEAEALGLRATGIGCFFDEPVHRALGLSSALYRSLYHFTVGTPLEDRRLTSLPAYPPPADDA